MLHCEYPIHVRISVIVPVFNGSVTLPACLRALRDSQYPIAECFVIDDGSTDDSAALAESNGATVLSTGGRRGPAAARNLGVLHATGELLFFLDADVEIHPGALRRIADRFESEPELDALIGSYDDSPSDPGFVSQFKNLMHASVHRDGNSKAFTFWCGCGAVKRSVYLEEGGLDESYTRPSIEDIEFGFRMLRSGRRLALDPQVQCKHLKVWTLRSLVQTDVLQRGIPWTELILRTRFLPDDLNLRWSQRASVVLTFVLAALGCALAEGLLNGRALPPVRAAVCGMSISVASVYFLNRSFYRFLTLRKGFLFSVRAIAMHLLYFFYSGLSFAAGAVLFGFRCLSPKPIAPPCDRAALQGLREDEP